MIILEEAQKGTLRVRVLECDCAAPGCTIVFIVGMLEPKPLWLTLAVVPESTMRRHLRDILTAPAETMYVIAHGIALCGMVYSKLDRVSCLHQSQAWDGIPDWMARVPIETVWAARGWVFGNDVTRTIRALQGVDRAVPELEEGPVPAPSMEQLIGRQMKVAYDPEKRSMS